MSNSQDNRKRAFADVVTIEAWHDNFDSDHPKVDLHADVVFGIARLGGELESPVRFRLSVKRAELVVIIPDLEPVSVDAKSVSRDSPEFQGHLTEVTEEAVSTNLEAGVSGVLNTKGASVSASGATSMQTGRTAKKKLEMSAEVKLLIVTQSRSPEGFYRWLIERGDGASLDGRPWDASAQPRLKLIDERSDRSKGIPPTVRVEVRCRREDLDISDVQIKDENIWDAVKARAGFKNRMAAAEAYIRMKLAEEGLYADNFDDIFGRVTLGSTTAQSD